MKGAGFIITCNQPGFEEKKLHTYKWCSNFAVYKTDPRRLLKKFPSEFQGFWFSVFWVCSVGDLGLIPGLRRSPGRRHVNPLQYSCLENPHGQKSLVGYSPWGHKEFDTTDWVTKNACMHTLYRLPQIFFVLWGQKSWLLLSKAVFLFSPTI